VSDNSWLGLSIVTHAVSDQCVRLVNTRPVRCAGPQQTVRARVRCRSADLIRAAGKVVCIMHPPTNWAGWRSCFSNSIRTAGCGDRNPVGARYSAPAQTGPGAFPASCTMGTGFLPGGKAAWAWRWSPSRIKRRGYRRSPSGPSWTVLGWNVPFFPLNTPSLLQKWWIHFSLFW